MSEGDIVSEERMVRMEAKMDKLVDAVTELASVNLEIKHMNERLNAHSQLINKNDTRLDTIEQRVPIYNLGIRIGAIFGTVFIAGIATAVYQLVFSA